MITPRIQPPPFDVAPGRSRSRLNATVQNSSVGFNLILPFVINVASAITTDVIDFRGFDSFTLSLLLSRSGVQIELVFVDPFDGLTELSVAVFGVSGSPIVNTIVFFRNDAGLGNLYLAKLRVHNVTAGAANLTAFGPMMLES